MAAKVDDKVEGVREQDKFLPIANISRIMKEALPQNAKISKDAKELVQQCVSDFIIFITSECGCFESVAEELILSFSAQVQSLPMCTISDMDFADVEQVISVNGKNERRSTVMTFCGQ